MSVNEMVKWVQVCNFLSEYISPIQREPAL